MITGFITGVILVARPNESVQLISILLGVMVILLGAGAWVTYFTKFHTAYLAVLGTMAVVGGIILCVKYKSIISFVIFMFGIFVIVSGVVDFVSAIDARRNDLKSWLFSIVMSVALIILGLIVVVNPFNSVMLLTRLLGISLIAYAVADLIAFIQVRRVHKLTTIKDKNIDEIVIDETDIE